MIIFQCRCGQNLQVGDELAGCKARCPKCRAAMMVPESEYMRQRFEMPPSDGDPTVSSNKDKTIPPVTEGPQ